MTPSTRVLDKSRAGGEENTELWTVDMVNIIVVVILARLVGVVLTDSSAAQLMRSLDHVQQIVLRHITLVRQRTDAVIHRLSYTVLTGARRRKKELQDGRKMNCV